jgi:hypothetical protein
MKRLLVALLIIVAFVACNRRKSATSVGAASTDGSKYAGTWRALTGDRDIMKITAEGPAFVVERGGRKRVAVIENGILKVTSEAGNVAALHIPSSDHIIVADVEFERVTDAAGAKVVNADHNWKRTLADMRAIATAWEARATDWNTYKVAEIGDGNLTSEDLQAALAPTYIKSMPTDDAYNEPFLFSVSSGGQSYEIRSTGENRTVDETPAGPFDDMAQDTVFTNGAFVSYPREAEVGPNQNHY